MQSTLGSSCDGPRATPFAVSIVCQALLGHRLNLAICRFSSVNGRGFIPPPWRCLECAAHTLPIRDRKLGAELCGHGICDRHQSVRLTEILEQERPRLFGNLVQTAKAADPPECITT